MADAWLDRWNERYKGEEYAYGTEPNDYLKGQLAKFTPGTILFPADGEGRNGVFAARQGWNVFSFDISVEGQRKALQLAKTYSVQINYTVGPLENQHYQPGQFDAIALIYAHFPTSIRSKYHQELSKYLRRGGVLIVEAYSKNHLEYIARNPAVGGPQDITMLFSIEEMKRDFPDFEILELFEQEVELHEGDFHHGIGSVIRFTGIKQ